MLPTNAARGSGRASEGPATASRPFLPAMLGAACISCSAILVTLAAADAATTAFYRCGLALPVLVMLARREHGRLGPRPRRARLTALAAGLLLGIDLVLWNKSIPDIGAGPATVLGNLQVVFVAVAAWTLLGERPRGAFLAALPAVLGGVVLVSGLADGGSAGANALAGIAFGLTSSLAYAGFLLLFRRSSAGPALGRPRVAGPLADATAGATIAALACGLAFGGFSVEVPWAAFGWLLLLSFSSQTVGWLLITSSLPRLPAAVASLLLLLQPACSLALAAVILHQRPTLLQVTGAVLVCGGIVAASGIGRGRAPGPAAE